MMDANTVTTSRRFAPKEVRKQQLIDATLEVIAEKGVSGTTTTLVTKKAGLSAGIVNLHFENKDNLLKATLEHLATELRDCWQAVYEDDKLQPADKLWGIIQACFDPDVCTIDKIRVWFAFFGEAPYRAFYREMVSRFDDERGDAMTALIIQLGQSEGAAERTSEAAECLADGLWLNMMLYPEWYDRESSRAQIWHFLFLHFPDQFSGPVPDAGICAT